MSIFNGVEVWGLSETLTFMTKAKKNTKAVRRQRHNIKSYFSLPLFGSDSMRDCITFAISPAVRSCVWSQDVAFAPLKSFPIHSPHPLPPPRPRAPCQGFCLWAKQMNDPFKGMEEAKCTHLFRVPASYPDCHFPRDLSVLFQSEEANKSANWTLPTWWGPFVLTPPESLLSSELDSCLGCGSLHRTRRNPVVHLNKGQLAGIKETQHPCSFLWRFPGHSWACGKQKCLWLVFEYPEFRRRWEGMAEFERERHQR